MVIPDQQKTDLTETRRNFYIFLSRIFWKELKVEDLDSFEKSQLTITFRSLGYTLPEIDRSSAALDVLATEYCRLFIGPGKHVSPHESIHRQGIDNSRLWGEIASQVKGLYQQYGLEMRDECDLMPDHISLEFEFMGRLIAEQIQTSDPKWYDLQKHFFDQHLNRWVPDFCRKVMKRAEHEFYGIIAQITRDFIEFEQEQFSI